MSATTSSPGSGGPGDARADHRAWCDLLDRLERDVEATERLLEAEELPVTTPQPEPWQPPEIGIPLPDSLLERALALHRRQSAAREALAEALARARARQRQVSRATRTSGRPTTGPAYVDVSA